MRFNIRRHLDAIAVLEARGALTQTRSFVEMRGHCRDLIEDGCRAILVDLKEVRRANLSGMAALVALAGEDIQVHLAFCGFSKHMLRKLQAYGLDRGLHIHARVQDALKSPEVQRAGLCHTRAVILCNEEMENLNPLSRVVPTAMLDILGQPLITRIMSHLAHHGVRDIIANPGHLGSQFFDYFRGAKPPHQALVFSNEGGQQGQQWTARPLRTASSLRQIQARQNAFMDDFLVLYGNTLTDVDLAALKTDHLRTGADVTIAVNAVSTSVQETGLAAVSESSNTIGSEPKRVLQPSHFPHRDSVSAFVMSPKALDLVPEHQDWDLLDDLIPALMARRRPVGLFRSNCFASKIRSPHEFADVLIRGLNNRIPELPPVAPQNSIYAPALHSGGARHATSEGRFYIHPDAEIAPNVELVGNCVVGARTRITGPCVLEDCIVLNDTKIAPGFWGQNLILHSDWAIDHRFNETLPTMPAPFFGEVLEADIVETPIRKTA